MKKLFNLLVIAGCLLSFLNPAILAAEELNSTVASTENSEIATQTKILGETTVIPGMTRETGALVAASTAILGFAALMILDDGSTTQSHGHGHGHGHGH